jgi:hypothetical protein
MAPPLLARIEQAQPCTIDCSKVAAGGTASSNGQLSISGTAGQHDACGPMTGGTSSPSGGFWSLIQVVQTPGAPALTITHTGNQVIISGLPLATGWKLPTANFMPAPGSIASARS